MWARDPSGTGTAWPGSVVRLAKSLERPISFLNRSHGGARSLDVLAALELEPAIVRGCGVVVFAGANDLWRRWVPWGGQESLDPDDYARALKRIVDLCRENGAIQIALMTPCLLHSDPDHPWNQVLAEYREEVARVARAAEALLVPSGEELLGAVRALPEVKWTYDGVHPRPVGHERIALTWMHHVLGSPAWPLGTLPDKPDGFRLSSWP